MLATLTASANSRTENLSGSWINSKVIQYYKSDNIPPCNNNFYANDEFIPLSLSFNNKNQINIIFRNEQRILTYDIKSVKENTIVISRGKIVFTLTYTDGALKLEYNKHTIFFTKVSDSFTIDAFAEFIKSEIFKEYDNYLITALSENKDFNNTKISRNSFESIFKKIFKCKYVNVVPLGLFNYKNYCLPEIALYYDEQSKQSGPKIFGVMKDEEGVKFIDASGIVALIIKGVKK